MIKPEDFTRVNNDAYGNPRHVIHFLQCEPESWKAQEFSGRYAAVCSLMNKIHGRKFHNKQYGGGIVFQSYSLPETIKHIERVIAEVDGPKKGYLKKDRQERHNLKRAWFVNAYRIVDASGRDMVQPWSHTKTEARKTAKQLGIVLIEEGAPCS